MGFYPLPQIIAHRGASGYAPENTLAAFRKAHALGASWVEFDVILSADDIPIIFHDEVTTRTTNLVRRKIIRLTLAEIKQLDAGSWFAAEFADEKIPTRAETLQFLQANSMQANIELKANPGQEDKTAAQILAELDKIWPAHQTLPLFSSFDRAMLQSLRAAHDHLPLALIDRTWEESSAEFLSKLNCCTINLNAHYLSKPQVTAIKNLGYGILCYTVNDRSQANLLFQWGVDGIFTDYPDLYL